MDILIFILILLFCNDSHDFTSNKNNFESITVSINFIVSMKTGERTDDIILNEKDAKIIYEQLFLNNYLYPNIAKALPRYIITINIGNIKKSYKSSRLYSFSLINNDLYFKPNKNVRPLLLKYVLYYYWKQVLEILYSIKIQYLW